MQNTSIARLSEAPPPERAAESTAVDRDGPSLRRNQRRVRRRLRRTIEQPALFDANDVPPIQNRLRIIALHVPWYGFRTQSRLAKDSGISRAAVSRLVRHQVQPSLSVALRLTRSLSVRLGRPLDVWEVFSLDGTYPTASACELSGCRSCSLEPKTSSRGKGEHE